MERQSRPQVGQQLWQQGYTPQEAEAIVRRGVELQQQSESVAAPVSHSTLEASAEAVGVRPEFVQQAAEEVRARQQTQARQAVVRRQSRAQVVAMVVAFIVAALIAGLFTLRVSHTGPVEVRPVPAVQSHGPAEPARPERVAPALPPRR